MTLQLAGLLRRPRYVPLRPHGPQQYGLAVIAALACAVALPARTQASTVAWSTKKPPAVKCGTPRFVSTGNGYANIKDCLVVSRSASTTWSSGTNYYQGVLEVKYRRVLGYRGDVLGGKSMIARSGTPLALGVNDCPRQRWIDGEKRWCYSPTKSLPPGQIIYGKGVLLNQAAHWYPPVWSALLRTSPASCDGTWRPDGEYLDEEDSPWMATRPPPVGSRKIQFRITSGTIYRKWIWDPRRGACRKVRESNRRATKYRLRVCSRGIACETQRWQDYTHRDAGPKRGRLNYPGRKYAWDPINPRFRFW